MGIVWTRKSTYLVASIAALALLLVSLFFALQKPVTLAVDGKEIHTRAFFANSVGEVLEKNNITLGEKDSVEPSLNSRVTKNMIVKVNRAFKIKVIADGKTTEIITTAVPVKEAIKLAGIKLGSMDVVKTLPAVKIVPNQEIEVIRVTQTEETVEEPIPFGEELTVDHSLEKGLTRTVSQGINGLANNTVKITYHNGQEVKREVVKTEQIREPKNKVVAMGTITSVSRSGQNLNFREARYMTASAYTYTGSRTATGKTPAVGMVAVDPRVIPLGTRLYVEGYGYAVASDTGGAIKGDRLDLFMEQHLQCVNWGRRTVKVYVLN